MLHRLTIALVLLLWSGGTSSFAQSSQQLLVKPAAMPADISASSSAKNEAPKAKSQPDNTESAPKGGKPEAATDTQVQFRVERLPVDGGAELLTIFGRLDGVRSPGSPAPEVPLLTVVRDTLNDDDPDNDRLRYVWVLTYTNPNLLKRMASAVPFFYQHVGNQTSVSSGPPKPIIDLANTSRQTWNRFFWMGLQNIFLDSYGIPLKASSRTYRQNSSDYRSGHVMQALSILDSYEKLRQRLRSESELLARSNRSMGEANVEPVADTSTPLLPQLAFTPGEMLEIRARLILSSNTVGGLLGRDIFATTVMKRNMASVDNSGHNWEMLRQRAEAEGLYFEPLKMPDGDATHAILWVAKPDLQANTNREFHNRFLNIANPWKDQRLRDWKSYSRVSYFDQDSRQVAADTPGAHPIEMIPLALYGLNHPKIPALLVDFRDGLNPKKREMSRRVFYDLARNVFSLSNFGSFPYFVGHSVFDFITGRRGMDLNQPTRLRSYSELKLLLSFNAAIDPPLRHEIERRVQNVSVNPLNNDNETEVWLANKQYDALLNYARRPQGLAAKIERDRRAEMVPLNHGQMARFFYNLGNALSFGRYVHREQATPELYERLEMARRFDLHTQFLKKAARSAPQTDVAWDLVPVKRSLQFFVNHGAPQNNGAARAAATIFSRTTDAEVRSLALDTLSKINNKAARAGLLKIYQQEPAGSELRADVATRLHRAVASDASVKPAEAKSILSQLAAP